MLGRGLVTLGQSLPAAFARKTSTALPGNAGIRGLSPGCKPSASPWTPTAAGLFRNASRALYRRGGSSSPPISAARYADSSRYVVRDHGLASVPGALRFPLRAVASLLSEPHTLGGERGAPVSVWSVPEFARQHGMYGRNRGRERLPAAASHAERIQPGSPRGATATGRRCQRPFRLCEWLAHRRGWFGQES